MTIDLTLFHYLQILHTLPKNHWHVRCAVMKGSRPIKTIFKVHQMLLTWECWYFAWIRGHSNLKHKSRMPAAIHTLWTNVHSTVGSCKTLHSCKTFHQHFMLPEKCLTLKLSKFACGWQRFFYSLQKNAMLFKVRQWTDDE